jgi:uncharacterized protein YlaI
MARKYLCDNCGKKIQAEVDLAVVRFCYFEDGEDYGNYDVAELCEGCKDKLEKIIKEGFQ